MTYEENVSTSADCPIVLVCGFLGPSNAHWCNAYWGQAIRLKTAQSPILIPPISSVASAFDRACELFAALKGLQVDYGEAHASEHGHSRYGKDYSKKAFNYAEWSAMRPVHLVGHSFGGNTIRVLLYLLEIDFWKAGTSAQWVRSITTISSPLQGSLLTYALGANEDHEAIAPVQKYSVGYILGIGLHFYDLVAEKLNMKQYLDFGLDHWNLHSGGWNLFLCSCRGGSNGGGTPSVCKRDNAAHDLTIYAALEWNEKIRSTIKQHEIFEINVVARKRFSDYSFRTSVNTHFLGAKRIESSNPQDAKREDGFYTRYAWATALCCRDLFTYYAAKISSNAPLLTLRDVAKKKLRSVLSVEDHLSSCSDGLCSELSQVSGNPQQPQDKTQQNLPTRIHGFTTPQTGGHYVIDLDDHDHFSVVPLPQSAKLQHKFFNELFTMLRSLPIIER